MSSFPGSPSLLKGGIVLVDVSSGAMLRPIALQYNPDKVTRSFQIQGAGAESTERSEPLRRKGPAVETIRLEAEIDATDQLGVGDATAGQLGIQPQLAALESLVHPSSDQLKASNALAASGTLEIAPMEAPLALFVWSKERVVPVRVTEFSITEEAFDPNLNPIRATVTLSLRVLSIDDLGFAHRGGTIFMSYLQHKEQLAQRAAGASLRELGIESIP